MWIDLRRLKKTWAEDRISARRSANVIVVYSFGDDFQLWWKARDRQWLLREKFKEGGRVVRLPFVMRSWQIADFFQRNKDRRVGKPLVLR